MSATALWTWIWKLKSGSFQRRLGRDPAKRVHHKGHEGIHKEHEEGGASIPLCPSWLLRALREEPSSGQPGQQGDGPAPRGRRSAVCHRTSTMASTSTAKPRGSL